MFKVIVLNSKLQINNNEHVQSYCTQLQTLFKQLVNVHCRLCVLATLCTWVAAERGRETGAK